MNSSKYSRTSNYEAKLNHRPYWKRKEPPYSHAFYKIPLSQFIKENESKSNYIDFANVNLKEMTKENFSSLIEKIISCLNKKEPDSSKEENTSRNIIPKEAVINIMQHGLSYYKSAPVINLLINLRNVKEVDKNDNDELNCDDLIIFFLKKVSLNFEKFDDFLDSMVILTGYLTKNLIKNNSPEEESKNTNIQDKDKEK